MFVFTTSFHGLITDFFLAMDNIFMSGCATVCLFIHLLKDILVASVLAIINKAATNICV